jgi:hypothetical protein
MSVILLVLGILLTGAGVVTLGYGISINETNLGNALIIAGTTSFCAGLLLIGLAAAVVQLNQIARALRPRAGARPPRPGELTEHGSIPAAALRQPPVPAAPPAPPMRSPVPPKPKIEERIPPATAAEPAPQVSASATERLRFSLGRGDRKAASAKEGEALAPAGEPPAPQVHAGSSKLTNGATPPAPAAGVEAAEAPRKAARLDFLFRGKPRATPSDSFDVVWSKRGAPRADEHANESVEPPPWPPEAPDAGAEEPSQPPAILKSGVVDGMAYTLYADGSIEAQLPQGTVRFGSITELRAHIENNS